jgi:hypothetical protein
VIRDVLRDTDTFHREEAPYPEFRFSGGMGVVNGPAWHRQREIGSKGAPESVRQTKRSTDRAQ